MTDHSDIEEHLGISFSTTTEPTDTQVDSIIAKQRVAFANELGTLSESTDSHAEILELMSIRAIARSYHAVNNFASSVQTPNGVYTFSEGFLADLRAELDEKKARAFPNYQRQRTGVEHVTGTTRNWS